MWSGDREPSRNAEYPCLGEGVERVVLCAHDPALGGRSGQRRAQVAVSGLVGNNAFMQAGSDQPELAACPSGDADVAYQVFGEGRTSS